LAKYGGKRRVPDKDREVADGFRTVFSKICPDLMELLEQEN
jgi:hypothetical protein